jgi:hypothetical protein
MKVAVCASFLPHPLGCLPEVLRKARGGRRRFGTSDPLHGAWRAPRYGTSALMPVVARPMMSFWICEVPS